MELKRDAQAPIRISFKDHRPVFVEANDQDRFVLTGREAAQACKLADDLRSFQEEFVEFLAYLNSWCGRHESDIKACYVSVGAEGLTVFVVVFGDHYRMDFADTVTTLDLELVPRFRSIRADVVQIPERSGDDLNTFFSLGKSIQAYGIANRPPA